MAFDQSKKPFQITPDPEVKMKKPKPMADKIPNISGLDKMVEIAKFAFEAGIDGETLKDPEVFTTVHEMLRRGMTPDNYRELQQAGVCPMCGQPGCGWWQSRAAFLMGFRRF